MNRIAGPAALAIATASLIWSSTAPTQSVVMRRAMPNSIRPGSAAATIPILPDDPRDKVAACDPATEECTPDNADYDYGWFTSCQARPITTQCVRFGRTDNSFGTTSEAACATAQPATGILSQVEQFPAGSKPTIVQVYALCGIRDVYDLGWSIDCTAGTAPICIGANSYTGDVQQYDDGECTTPATTSQAQYAKAAGLVPTGTKPNVASMCGTSAGVASFGPWQVYDSSKSGLAALGDAYVCSGKAGRVITMACSYQGGQVAAGGQDCDYQTDQFVSAQQGKSNSALRNVGGGKVVESRLFGDDPLLFGGCTWQKSADPDTGLDSCLAMNMQGPGSHYYGTTAFQNHDCSGSIMQMTRTSDYYVDAHWNSLLGDSSSGASGARSYCYASGPDDDDPYSYFTTYAPNACVGITRPDPNHGN